MDYRRRFSRLVDYTISVVLPNVVFHPLRSILLKISISNKPLLHTFNARPTVGSPLQRVLTPANATKQGSSQHFRPGGNCLWI
jgi:hypothetical protein